MSFSKINEDDFFNDLNKTSGPSEYRTDLITSKKECMNLTLKAPQNELRATWDIIIRENSGRTLDVTLNPHNLNTHLAE